MANHVSHAALPYPIKGARFSIMVPLLDADGDPTAQTTPDTEVSLDNAAAADATEEVSATSGMDGMGLITFSGAETNVSVLAANFKAASGPKATLATLYPRVLASIGTGTLSAGSAGGGTLGTILTYSLEGCFIKTTGGTGGGGTGGANNQARKIVTYNNSTGAFTVSPNWETTPDATTTYELLLPEGISLGMLISVPYALPDDPDGLVSTTAFEARTLAAASYATASAVDAIDNLLDTEFPALVLDVAAILVDTSTTLQAELDGIQADTEDIQSRLPAALTGDGNIKADMLAVSGDTAAADWLEREYDGTGAGELLIRTTIATRASNSDFTLTAGSADNSAYLYGKVIVRDQSTSTQFQVGYCSVYTGGTKRVQLLADPGIFTTATGDIVEIHSTEAYNTWNASLDRTLSSGGNEAIATAVLAAGTNGGLGDSVDECLQRLDATVSSRASQSSVNTIDDFLDTEVAAILAAVDTEVAAILVDTGTDIPATLAALFTTALVESYNTDGAAPTVAQVLFGVFQTLTEGAISGTGWTVKKLDGSTTAFGITLDSATTPTTKTRSS